MELRTSAAPLRWGVELAGFEKLQAEHLSFQADHLIVETTSNQFLYAAWSKLESAEVAGNLELVIDAEIESGAFSVSILDVDSQSMVVTACFTEPGRQVHVVPIEPNRLPNPFRIILSNLQATPAKSRFKVFEITIVQSPLASELVRVVVGARRFVAGDLPSSEMRVQH